MRVAGRAVLSAAVALLVGLALSFIVAAALRSATPEADLLWRAAPTGKVAMWVLNTSHGSQLTVEAGAEITNERLRDIGDKIGDVIGSVPGAPNVPQLDAQRGEFSVGLASFTILGLCGAALALMMRNSGVDNIDDALVASAVAAGTYAVGLAGLAAISRESVGFNIRIARAGIDTAVPPLPALGMGLFWGAAFALIGSLAAPRVVERLSTEVRAVGAGLRRAGVVAALAAIVCLAVLGLTRGGGGGLGSLGGRFAFVGALVLGVNVIAAGVVLAHGPTMTATFTAGPLDDWTRIGYASAGSPDLPVTRWLFLVVPAAAGFAAGRVMARRTANAVNAAVMFAIAWGIALAATAVMLRVRILSSFTIDAIDGGGGAEINPLVALLAGAVWGGVSSYIGFLSARSGAPAPTVAPAAPVATPVAPSPVIAPAPQVRTCSACGAQVPVSDRFCGSCGKSVDE